MASLNSRIKRLAILYVGSPTLQAARAKMAAGASYRDLTDDELEALIDADPLDRAGRAAIEAMTDEELETVIAGEWPASGRTNV